MYVYVHISVYLCVIFLKGICKSKHVACLAHLFLFIVVAAAVASALLCSLPHSFNLKRRRRTQATAAAAVAAAQQKQRRPRQQRQPLKSRWVFIINDITTTNWVTGKRQQRWSRTRITFYVIYCNFVGRPPWQARALPLAPCCTFSFTAAARQHKGAPAFLTKWAGSRQQAAWGSRQQQMLLHT